MNTVFSYSRNSKVRLTHTKINLTYCLITILTCAFCLTVANGCSNDLRENSEDKITAKAEPVNFEDIKEQINKSLKFRREGLAKFDEESKESNREFLRDRAKQEQLAMHLWSSIEKVREHIEFVKTGKKIRDRFEILSSDERLEVAKLAETVLANSDESAIKEASTSAYEKQKRIEEKRELHSTSRYEEKKRMKAEANAAHPEFHTAFKPLVKNQTPQEFGFALDEVTGKFSESTVNFMYKNDDGKRLWLGVLIRTEPTKYVNPDSIKKREQYMLAVESKNQLVLETGRLFISMKTDADFKEGDLWKCFKGITDGQQMKRLADELQ